MVNFSDNKFILYFVGFASSVDISFENIYCEFDIAYKKKGGSGIIRVYGLDLQEDLQSRSIQLNDVLSLIIERERERFTIIKGSIKDIRKERNQENIVWLFSVEEFFVERNKIVRGVVNADYRNNVIRRFCLQNGYSVQGEMRDLNYKFQDDFRYNDTFEYVLRYLLYNDLLGDVSYNYRFLNDKIVKIWKDQDVINSSLSIDLDFQSGLLSWEKSGQYFYLKTVYIGIFNITKKINLKLDNNIFQCVIIESTIVGDNQKIEMSHKVKTI